ncbi:MAG: OmpA/MotB domain-containing protein [Bacteroidetes bacterium]|nr:MAG: OmpA/MotB domain-containing protein [Bacteroidota bacterium]
MKYITGLFLVLLILSCKVPAQAQPPVSTTNKKAEKLYTEGMDLLAKRQLDKGIDVLNKAKKADPVFVEPYLVLGDLYVQMGEKQLAINEFKKAFEINPGFFPNSFVTCAEEEYKLGRYEDALAHYKSFQEYRKGNGNSEYAKKAEAGLKNCSFAIESMKKPVPFDPKNMGAAINTADCEYFPGVTADDATFLFTRNKRVQTGNILDNQEDFFVSTRKADGSWTPSMSIGSPINTPRNEGAPSLSPDGRFLFFTACADYNDYGEGRRGFGSCDLFYSERKGKNWSNPVNLGRKINSEYWESQPSFSSDGRTLYFVSNRKGGEGDGDIWMCALTDQGEWGEVVNLGPVINTPNREEAVFIHPDNMTLYFASKGHPGMGGLDLFVSHRKEDGSWGVPQNLGFPINTFKDESGMIVNGKGNMAYFSSDRAGTLGCEDLYEFLLPEPARATQVTYMKGKVYDAKTKKPLAAAFELIDLATGKTVVASMSDEITGEFLVCVPANKNYALNVSRPGYVFYSESFMLKESPDSFKPVQRDVPLQPILNDVILTLNNVFFETGKYDLKPESKAELNKLVAFLNANPLVKGELGGHTDSIGNKKDNLVLSNNRAKSVMDYLITNGIPASRLSYKGYGDAVPVATNATPEGRQRNRRTELKFTSVK